MFQDNKECVVLVDENDTEIGTEERMKAHKKGDLHRAFSIFIFNSKGELLIQKRAKEKYHSGGLWSNSCCGHPRPNESTIGAAHRRLKEEMGFDCVLEKTFKFYYKAVFDNGLTENEIDTVFVGEYNSEISPNKDEVSDFKWISIKELQEDMIFNNKNYTEWFKIAFNKYMEIMKSKRA